MIRTIIFLFFFSLITVVVNKLFFKLFLLLIPKNIYSFYSRDWYAVSPLSISVVVIPEHADEGQHVSRNQYPLRLLEPAQLLARAFPPAHGRSTRDRVHSKRFS